MAFGENFEILGSFMTEVFFGVFLNKPVRHRSVWKIRG